LIELIGECGFNKVVDWCNDNHHIGADGERSPSNLRNTTL
jgi:hypothetical protein